MDITNELNTIPNLQGLEDAMAEVFQTTSLEALDRAAQTICKYRKEAIMFRQASGIEAKWRWCNMAFSGEDEIKAGRGSGDEFLKSTAGGGTMIPRAGSSSGSGPRSTAVLNITAPAVEFAGWAVLQLAAPTEKQRWALAPTPQMVADEVLPFLQHLPQGGAETLKQALEVQRQSAKEEIAVAETQIKDWFAESPVPFRDALVELFEDAPRMGSGVLKGPVPMRGKKGFQPGYKVVDVRNCFPAPDCGKDVKNGSFFFELDFRSRRFLASKTKPMAALDGWIPKQVQKVLEEGPKTPVEGALTPTGGEFQLWLYQGPVSKDALVSVGLDSDSMGGPWAHLTLINDTIVRVGPAPLPNTITYNVLKWRRRWINEKEFWAGRGIAEEAEDVQRSATSHWRNLNDNSSLAAVPQRIRWKGIVKPDNGRYEWAPGKDWIVENKELSSESIKDVKNAFMFIDIPAHLPELRKNVEMDLRMLERVTGIDEMVMGMAGPTSVGGGQMQLNAAAHLPRRVKTYYDKSVLRPVVEDSLAWIRKYKPEQALGEVSVTIEGSKTEIKRDVQASALVQGIQLAVNPIFGHDPALLFDQWMEGNEFDPDSTRLTPERAEALAAQSQEGPDEKAQAGVESATIRAQALTAQSRIEAETDRIGQVLDQERGARERAHAKEMLLLKMKMELITYAQKKGIDLRSAAQELEAVEVPRMMTEQALNPPVKTPTMENSNDN